MRTILSGRVGSRRAPTDNRAAHRRTALAKAWFVFALFIAPAVFLLVTTRLIPLTGALSSSLGTLGDGTLLDTYAYLFSSQRFWNSVGVTLWFVLVIVPAQIVLALAFAAALTERLPAVGLWRTLIFLPVAIPQAVSTIVWGVAFRPTGGLANSALQFIGIGPQPWLTSPDQALYAIMVIASWVGVGYWMMFLIAGLQDIPRSVTEAAALDGAGWWRTFFSIKLPLLSRPLAFVLVANTVANFLLFVPVQVLTRGGPAGSTNLLIHEIYRQAFTFGDATLANAQVVMLSVLMLAIVTIQFRLLQRLT
jgi:multiple sugar transport system permease protein